MKKYYVHKGYKFYISVELNHKLEKRIDGKRLHDVTVVLYANDTYEIVDTRLCESKDLQSVIINMQKMTEKLIDDRINNYDSNDIELLKSMGFFDFESK